MIVEKIEIITVNKTIVLCWIPSHTGIAGNEQADAAAKAALTKEVDLVYIPQSDFKPIVNSYIYKLWQESWDKCIENKLHKIMPTLHVNTLTSNLHRKEQVILIRLKLGHTQFTRAYLMKAEGRPICESCR